MSIQATRTCYQCQEQIPNDGLHISLNAYQDNNHEHPELKKRNDFCSRTCLERWLSFPPHIEEEPS